MSSWITITTPSTHFTLKTEEDVKRVEDIVMEFRKLQTKQETLKEGFETWWKLPAYQNPVKDEEQVLCSPCSISAFKKKLAAQYAWEAGRLFERLSKKGSK